MHAERMALSILSGTLWRYFTAVACGSAQYDVTAPVGRLCLAFIEGQGYNTQHKGHTMHEGWAAGLTSGDGGQTFNEPRGQPIVIAPSKWVWQQNNQTPFKVHGMTHNLALHRFNASHYTLVGGTYDGKGMGVHAVHGEHWYYDRSSASSAPLPSAFAFYYRPTQWSRPHKLFDGTHAGCFEAPAQGRGLHFVNGSRAACVFDGRLSLVHFRGRYLLYARMNPVDIGQRFVQVTTSEVTPPRDEMPQWKPFRPIHIDDYTLEDGNIYFFAVCVNPVRQDSLVALAPLVHDGVACIAIALSRDGIHWSALQPLVGCPTDMARKSALAELKRSPSEAVYRGHRGTSHPVANVLLWKDRVLFFVHEHVPGISDKRNSTSLVRYSVPQPSFASWTNETLTRRRDERGSVASAHHGHQSAHATGWGRPAQRKRM